MTLWHETVDATVDRHAGRPALLSSGTGVSLSYAQLQARTRRIAAALASLGVERGDRVLICLPNRAEVIEIALACSRIGAVFVPVSRVLKVRQLRHIVTDCQPRVAIAASARDELAQVGASHTLIVCDASPEPSPGMMRYEELLTAATEATSPRTSVEQDPLAILYTSGSTGLPKGVVLSHRNLVAGAAIVSGYLGNTEEDRILAALPLSFDYGLSQVTTALAVGACAILTNYNLVGSLLQDLAAGNVTGLAGVPTMWAHLANAEWPQEAKRRLRYITNSGGALAPSLLETLRRKLPRADIYCMYGLTEAFRSTYLDPQELDSRPGSIGKAIPTQEVLVLRPDGTSCEAGEIGELVHRGSLVTLGYWNAPELTAQRFRPLPRSAGAGCDEIAVWSGDQVRRDADGFIWFVGRADGLIKTSGYRVSPVEVEEIVAQVEGVVECCAVGLPDAVLGQRIAVGLIADRNAAAPDLVQRVLQHCRQHMPGYMQPNTVAALGKIPRTPNGKHDRSALAEVLRVQEPSFSASVAGSC